jgi:opacity protein-like surface antigen
MRIQKAFLLGMVISTVSVANANAKTEGNYLGLDLIRTELRFDSANHDGGINIWDIDNNYKTSLGINYKYSFNFNNFFIAPGIFYDYSNVKIYDSYRSSGDKWELNHRYGFGADIGYDINDNLGVFINLSLVRNMYKVDWHGSSGLINKDHDDSLSFGIGAKYSISKNLDVRASYERSSVVMKEPDAGNSTEFDVNIFRLGLAYKF